MALPCSRIPYDSPRHRTPDGSVGRTAADDYSNIRHSVAADNADWLVLRGLLHDLGHGLATLSWRAAAARSNLTPAAGGKDPLAIIEQETSRLLRLLRGGGYHPPASTAVRVDEVLRRAVEIAQATSATSVLLLPGPAVQLYADELLVWRVVVNVVDNALHAAGPHGTVAIRVAVERDVIIEVVDDGPGLSHEPADTASIGLGVVAALMKECAGCVELEFRRASRHLACG